MATPAVGRFVRQSGRRESLRMLVLHALWSPRRGPLIWGLDGDRPIKKVSQAVRSPHAHPFAAETTTHPQVHAGKPVTATLPLPSLRMAPLDSPELVRTTPRPTA